jgi:hypothetical protein
VITEAERGSGLETAAGNDRPDFDLIAVVEHFVFGHEIVAFDHEMRFDDEMGEQGAFGEMRNA